MSAVFDWPFWIIAIVTIDIQSLYNSSIMNTSFDWPSRVSAISTAITTFAVIGSWLVSRSLLKLQKGQLEIQKEQAKIQENQFNLEKSLSEEKKPLVYIWYNGPVSQMGMSGSSTENIGGGSFTIINKGGSSFPIRSMRILNCSVIPNTYIQFAESYIRNNKQVTGHNEMMSLELLDIIFYPNEIRKLLIRPNISQGKFEITYYDNTCKSIDIDTSSSTGPYIINGKGQKA